MGRFTSPRRREVLTVLAVLGVFALALVVWVGHLSGGPGTGTRAQAETGSPGATSGTSATGHPSSRTPAGTSLPAAGSSALPLPAFSTGISGGPGATHVVTIRVTSDATIVQLGYKVRGGHPASYYRTSVASPASVTTEARGNTGNLAAIGVQAAPTATFVTCSVAVDGVVVSTHTGRGGWAVVICVG